MNTKAFVLTSGEYECYSIDAVLLGPASIDADGFEQLRQEFLAEFELDRIDRSKPTACQETEHEARLASARMQWRERGYTLQGMFADDVSAAFLEWLVRERGFQRPEYDECFMAPWPGPGPQEITMYWVHVGADGRELERGSEARLARPQTGPMITWRDWDSSVVVASPDGHEHALALARSFLEAKKQAST